jgi:hypothetical protein
MTYYLSSSHKVYGFIELPDCTAYGCFRVVVNFSYFAMAYH